MLLSARPRQGTAGEVEIWNSPAFRLVDIGAFLAVSIVVPTWLGSVVDGRLGTGPVLTLVGLALGLAGGLYGAFRQLQDFLRLQSERRGK
ncbi:MAG: AtpZ/AtpI family protein [Dehalococcoidia bacterium]